MTNNYESVDFDECRLRGASTFGKAAKSSAKPSTEYSADTFNLVYSLQDNNIYEDEKYDDFRLDHESSRTKPRSQIVDETKSTAASSYHELENNTYITPIMKNPTIKSTLTKQPSLIGGGGSGVVSINTNTLTTAASQTNTLSAEQIYNTMSQKTSPPSIYSVKYLIDINDLKQHLNCDNCQSTRSLCTHTTTSSRLTPNRNIYEIQNPQIMVSGGTASNASLLDTESIYVKRKQHDQQQQQQSGKKNNNSASDDDDATLVRGRRSNKDNGRQVNINLNSRGVNPCCCVQAFVSFFYFISKILKCLKLCCCAPCCSMAALLGSVGALGGLLAGFAFLGVFGIIPIPMEVTKMICNGSEAQKFYYYNNNLTIIKEIGNFNYTNSDLRPFEFNRSNNWNSNNNDPKASFKVNERKAENDEIESRKFFALLNKNASMRLKAHNKYKNKLTKFMPISYNVLLTPSKLNTDVTKAAATINGMEMKINLEVELFCNLSTNLIYIWTKEFSNIELNIVKIPESENQIKKWKHDLESNILEIETVRNCSVSASYMLKMSILYKNYGTVHSYKTSTKTQQVNMASFIQGFENPFPIVVDIFSNPLNQRLQIASPNPSVFNITLARKRLIENMICNMDVLKKSDKGSTEYIYFKPSPQLHPYFLTFIFGDLTCRETENLPDYSVKLRICSLVNPEQSISSEVFTIISDQTRLLFEHFASYTKKDYELDKIDIVILPKSSVKSLLSTTSQEPKTTSVGILYIPDSYVTKYESYDYLNKLKLKFKITNSISKQLVKHWFYSSNDFHCESANAMANENDAFMEKINSIRAYCLVQNCTRNRTGFMLGRSVLADLHIYQSCFMYKAIVNWIGYLAFRSVYPDLFDLLKFEWSLIKDIDSNYFLDNKNIDHIYENYEFPILAESNNFKDIKYEIKNMQLIKTVYLIFGEEKFKNLVRDWFKTVEQVNHEKQIIETKINSNSSEVSHRIKQNWNKNLTIFTLLQQYIVQYDLIPFQDINVNDILTSWIFTENDLIVTIERNYNKKEAIIKTDSLTKLPMIDFYYPLSWSQGAIEINMKKRINSIETEKQGLKNIWLNQTQTKLGSFPGADQWIIGNSMSTFGLLRVNYDHQNWLMLTERLRYAFESFSVDERAQIIDDMFYLVNNQMIPISYGLNLLQYISEENRYLPWKYAVKHIKTILDYVEDHSQIYAKFREYIIELISPIYKRLQWGENYLDTFDEKLIRILVVDLLCYLDHDDCVENSVKQLSDIIKINVNNIPEYLRKIIYCTAIRHTSIKEWHYLWEVYQLAPETTQIKQTTLYSLSCSSQVWILNLLFNRLVYENSLSPTDLQTVIGFISRNPAGKYVVWNHISQNYQLFYDKIGNDPDLLIKLVQIATVGFKLKYEIKQVYNFMEEVGLAGGLDISSSKSSTAITNSSIIVNNSKHKLFNSIESRISRFAQWKASNANELDNWLNKKLSKIQI